MDAHDLEPHDRASHEIGRRQALGLGVLGVFGVGLSSSLLAGDAGPALASPPMHVGSPTGNPAGRQTGNPAGNLTGSLTRGLPPSDQPPHLVTTPTVHPASATAPVAPWHKPARSVHDLDPNAPKNAVALTIDDGPHPEWTPRVLDLLAKHEVKATFCLIGEQIRDNYKLVQLMVTAGHEVANHTWHHPININRLPAHRVESEIARAHRVIVEVTGTSPRLFRAPGGNWSPTVFKATARHGMYPIDWDIDPRDWSRPGVPHVTRALLKGKAGDILLCHDGGGDRSQTLKSLKTVLPRLKSRGLEFITL
jgi:peptidoglycan-N-acetylglucosamine deacetylase